MTRRPYADCALGLLLGMAPAFLVVPGRVSPAQAYCHAVIDDFSDGEDSGWIARCRSGYCEWSASSGAYCLFVESAAELVSTLETTATCSDYRYDVDVRNDSGPDKVIVFRRFNATNYYDLDLDSGFGRLILERVKNGVRTRLLDVPLASVPGVWYRLGLVLEGARISASVNGLPAVDVIDPDPILAGAAGVSGRGGQLICFDNVHVYDVHSEEDPTSATPATWGSLRTFFR